MASGTGAVGTVGRPFAALELDSLAVAPAIVAALISGLYAVVASISYASLVFSGEFEAFRSLGISMALTGSFLLGTVVALSSSYPGTIAIIQSETAIVLGVMAGVVAAHLGPAELGEQAPATLVVLVALSAAATGIIFLAIGALRLGHLVRYIPYPVVGAFLGGLGYLLVRGGISTMASVPVDLANLPNLLEPEVVIRWLPGLAVAVLAWGLQRRSPHFLTLPLTIVGVVLLFWLAAWTAGVPDAQLRADGWLLGPFPAGGLWTPLPQLAAAQHVRWDVVADLLPEIATLVLIALLTLLLNSGSLEIAAGQDIDLNRELRTTGLGNLCSALGGGFPGYISLSGSRLAVRIAAPSRLVGVITALLCGVTLLFGAAALSSVPKLAVGVLILYVGLDFLAGALFDAWFRLPRADYLVLLIVFVGIVFVGILPGVALGIVLGVVLFVVNYSRISVVHRALSGVSMRSNVERSEERRELLRMYGDASFILQLQGYIFFGTASGLLGRIRERLLDRSSPRLRAVVLDFRRVHGLDSSALAIFTRLGQYAERWDLTLVLTGLSGEVRRALQAVHLSDDRHPHVRTFPDLDRGLEYVEEQILALEAGGRTGCIESLEERLRQVFPDAAEVADVMRYLDRGTWREGDVLIRQGDASEDLFFIETGQVTVQLETPTGRLLRLRTMGAGTVVGEVALYLGLPRSASVVADAPATACRLTRSALHAMEEQDPRAATLFHKFLARMLAARLLDTNRLLEAYSDW